MIYTIIIQVTILCVCPLNKQLRKRGSSVVSALASGARGPRFVPRSRRGKFRSPNTLSLVSFVGMTPDKCIVLRIGTLTGCPLCRESHPLCRLKNPTVISIWLLLGCHPATRSVQCTPADNARKRAPGSIYRRRRIACSILRLISEVYHIHGFIVILFFL